MMGGGDLVIKGAARKESGKAELAAAKAKKEAEKHGSGESAADSGNKTQDGMNTLVLLLLHLVRLALRWPQPSRSRVQWLR